MARADARDLKRIPGIGRVKALELKAALELGRRMAHSQLGERSQVRTPADAAQMLMLDMGVLEQLVRDHWDAMNHRYPNDG